MDVKEDVGEAEILVRCNYENFTAKEAHNCN
jgi:hypothetical protein